MKYNYVFTSQIESIWFNSNSVVSRGHGKWNYDVFLMYSSSSLIKYFHKDNWSVGVICAAKDYGGIGFQIRWN